MKTEGELAEFVTDAYGDKRPLRIVGGGTRPIGNSVVGEVCSTAGLSGISLYEPGALTIVAQAGTPLAQVEAALAKEGQRLPFEPMDHRGILGTTGEPTIGGVVAGNISGPRRIQAGACRDSLIGVRFVNGEGVIVKNGGRVMKNVTGYDLVKLMAGSFGTLGVLTEVSFKVLPAAEDCAVLWGVGLNDTQAVAAMSAALGSPFDVSGVAHLPKGPTGEPMTFVRIEGMEKSVAYRSGELQKMLARFCMFEIETIAARTAGSFKMIRDVTPFKSRDGDIWRISVKPSDGPLVGVALGEVYYDWGGGLVWALVPTGFDVRSALVGIEGHATCVRGNAPTFEPTPAPLAAISKGLRAKFDPAGILNPGIMG